MGTDPQPRYFAVKDANAVIPVVAPVMVRVLALHGHLRGLLNQVQLAGVPPDLERLATGELRTGVVSTDRLLQHVRGLYLTIRDDIREVENTGAEVKDVESGIVDFPSWLDGRVVLLCWRVGEERVDWYHEHGAGAAGRKSISGLVFANHPPRGG